MEDQVQASVNPCEVFGGQSGCGLGFSIHALFVPVIIILANLHTSSFIHHDAE
jgi:hypothetical protein